MMTVHFLHIGKTGGTAIKSALHKLERQQPGFETPFGRMALHPHRFHLADVPPGDHAMFFVRDPISRFISGFNSRQRKGRPRYNFEWTPREREAFERFCSPEALAEALRSGDAVVREAAEQAMRSIRHLKRLSFYLGGPEFIQSRSNQIVFVGRLETLDADWEKLKSILELPPSLRLPVDPKWAHRAGGTQDTNIGKAGQKALKKWYANDYQVLRLCDEIRFGRGWADRRVMAKSRPRSTLIRLRVW